jgi:hypothetical protein
MYFVENIPVMTSLRYGLPGFMLATWRDPTGRWPSLAHTDLGVTQPNQLYASVLLPVSCNYLCR